MDIIILWLMLKGPTFYPFPLSVLENEKVRGKTTPIKRPNKT